MRYESVIGLEVHVQLRTRTKIFCRCPNRFGAPPNTLVCEVCLGYPGALPVLNRQAVDQAIRLSLALGATVRERSIFARKSYFYADSPKGYQISQFDQPLAVDGLLPLSQHDRAIRIQRLHLEEDAGKLLHEAPGGRPLDGESLVDLDRCGVPLLEIVSFPDLRTPAEAQDYLRSLHRVLLYTDTSDGNMEEGSLRCDANISIRPEGESALGTRTEIKNLNSFRHVARSLEYEIQRQVRTVESGQAVIQRTLSWDAQAAITRPLRGKEEAQDYRYFPEPDLPPLVVGQDRRREIADQLPEMPWAKRQRFVDDLGIQPESAEVLTNDIDLALYFESALVASPARPQSLANWLRNDLIRLQKERHGDGEPIAEQNGPFDLEPRRFAELVAMVDGGQLSSGPARQVLEALFDSNSSPEEIAADLGLLRTVDRGEHLGWLEEIVAAHPAQADAYRGGKTQIAGFFIGKAMQLFSGQADPKLLAALLKELLAESTDSGEGE